MKLGRRPEKMGNIYRYRVAVDGSIYEYSGRGLYEHRPKLTGKDVSAVPVPVRHVVYPITNGFVITHVCVLEVGCPHCGAKKGKLCRGTNGPTATRHWRRAAAWREKERIT